jgi:hypothetical protein
MTVEIITLRKQGTRKVVAETREISMGHAITFDDALTQLTSRQTRPQARATQTVDIGRRGTRNSRVRYRTLYLVR